MMKAIVYESAKNFVLRDIPVPKPEAGEVLLKVAYSGVCGSDLFIHSGKHPRAKAPLVPGHEFSAVVAEIPGGTTASFAVGDAVTIRPTYSCGVCPACREGYPHVCRGLRLYGIDCDGGFAEYMKVRVENVFALPAGTDLKAAALIEPVAVAVHALRRSELRAGDAVAVLGAGPIGCLVGMLAKIGGASAVYISDVNPFRLAAAESLGFRAVDATKENIVDAVREGTKGRMADVTFDCAGAAQSILSATELTRIQGQVMVVASFHAPMPVDLLSVNFREQQLKGTRVYTDRDYGIACPLVAERAADFLKIATVYPGAEAPAVVERIAKGENAIKALFAF